MSTASSVALPPRLSRKKLALLELDVASSTSLVIEIADENKAVMFFDGFYGLCTEQIEAHGGEVIKFMGDSCLASFPEDQCIAAVDALLAIRDAFPAYCKSREVPGRGIYGAVHVGEVVTGTFGPQGFRDVMGITPNTLFKLASQRIIISEQVYRKLPSERRSAWRKHGGQVTYVLK